MGQNVNFKDYIPPERFDSVSWETAKIEEAPALGGPWTLIDTVSIGAPDADPSDPQPRSFTTNAGTGPDLWYRAIFLDGASNVSEPTSAFQNTEAATAVGTACQQWITGDDILNCCDATIGTDVPLDTFAEESVALLFELSGGRFTGICQRTVRPCPGDCSCWARLDWHHPGFGRRGCRPLSTVKLAGYPVQEIVEVTIDGDVVDPAGYALKRGRDLVRLNDGDGKRQLWPACQDLGQTEGDNTFFVTYTYGVAPPVAGVEAATQLGCELVKACPSSGDTGDCAVPAGTVRLTRQGYTVEAQTLGLFLAQGTTGLQHVDAFLNVYGGRSRRPAVIMSPDVAPYAQEA